MTGGKLYDIAVIGGGPAGYVAAIKAAQSGGRVVLFEKDTLGGTCLNRGCIPTKTYVKTAEYLHNISNASQRGIHVDTASVSIDMARVVTHKNEVVKKLTGGVSGLLKAYGVDVIRETGKLKSTTSVEAGGKIFETKTVILCGGSVADTIPVDGIKHPGVLTSDGILELTRIPDRLAIIGGGVIGCEMAAAFAMFGSKVTIIEAMPSVVPAMDTEVSAVIAKSLAEMGIRVLADSKLKSVSDKAGKPVLNLEHGEKIEADIALLSVGRKADLECLGGLASQIKTERGKVITDDYMRTSVSGIYAAGDIVANRPMLAHAAFIMGETAAVNALGHNEKAKLSHVPSCLYTIPEAASVGLTEQEAAQTRDIFVGRFSFGANGRALASGEAEGFVKVIIDKKYGEILGVHIAGGSATEMIAEAVALMEMEITAHEAANIIHAHPTYSEAFMEACADALGRSIHLPPKKNL